jgi:hypothetical protein
MTSTRRRKPTSGKDTLNKMGNQKQTVKTKLKAIGAVAFFIIALGIVGHNDAEYANRPSVCRTLESGNTVCYKP